MTGLGTTLSLAGRLLAHAIGRAAIDGIGVPAGEVGPTGDLQEHLDLGTVFGILRRGDSTEAVSPVDFLQPGRELVAA